MLPRECVIPLPALGHCKSVNCPKFDIDRCFFWMSLFYQPAMPSSPNKNLLLIEGPCKGPYTLHTKLKRFFKNLLRDPQLPTLYKTIEEIVVVDDKKL